LRDENAATVTTRESSFKISSSLRRGFQLEAFDYGAYPLPGRFAVLAYADSMTRDVHVPDDVFDRVREHLDERHVVELTATIAAYNSVSRFLEALHIDHEAV
jgi:alkylhydroperoxidase family enzyme